MNDPQVSDPSVPEPTFPIDGPEKERGQRPPRGSDVESASDTSPDRVDPDSPASTLFNEGEDAVEPNEPG